jgi:ABC-2 type transport system ATP-binding protein
VLAVGGAIAVLVLLRHSPARVPIAILLMAAYLVVAMLTDGDEAEESTTEGGPAAPSAPAAVALSREQHEALRALMGRGASDAPGLVVEGLTKRFGDRVAVDDLSFSVAAGEVFGFLGPNGAGKTTTVRMLGTLIAPSAGSAIVAGIPLEPANGLAIRGRIAVMTENPGLYLRLTVAENLTFFAGLYGLPDPGPRIATALAAVNLGDRANDLCGSLSKGLRQRVGLARALLSEPAIVFLDEPTSGLDPVASREVHELIGGLRNRGVTVFLTTHRLEEAERLCDRVAILNTRLRTIGRPDELRDSLFTKTLVVRTAAPLRDPGDVLSVAGVEQWRASDGSTYVLSVSDARVAAPEVTRRVVAAGADLLSLSEGRHSLEEVYLELVEDDVEAKQ